MLILHRTTLSLCSLLIGGHGLKLVMTNQVMKAGLRYAFAWSDYNILDCGGMFNDCLARCIENRVHFSGTRHTVCSHTCLSPTICVWGSLFSEVHPWTSSQHAVIDPLILYIGVLFSVSTTRALRPWFTISLQVTITQTHKYEAAHDTYSNVSAEAGASYGGLFYHGGGSGGFDRKAGNSSLTKKGSNFSLTFKVRKVIINRSWMDPSLLLYTTIGIKGIPVGAWSSGELSATQNHGTFPLVPTAYVVAKDVTLKAESYSDYAEQSFKDMSAHAAFKVKEICVMKPTRSINLYSFIHLYRLVLVPFLPMETSALLQAQRIAPLSMMTAKRHLQ